MNIPLTVSLGWLNSLITVRPEGLVTPVEINSSEVNSASLLRVPFAVMV